jgi:hypothetical protein
MSQGSECPIRLKDAPAHIVAVGDVADDLKVSVMAAPPAISAADPG